MEGIGEYILSEKKLLKKIEYVYYLRNKKNLFFDNSVLFKLKLADLFINSLCIKVDKNLVLSACLVYSLNKIDTFGEKQRIKQKKNEDFAFLQSLGFEKRFCKICVEYNRVNELQGYVREKEGDILELVENFGGMLMLREERLAYSVAEAIDLLENRNLAGKPNRYLKDFKLFVDIMEQASKEGLITDLQKRMNKIKRNDISAGIRAIYDSQDMVENTFLGTTNELFEEQMKFFKLMKIATSKAEVLTKYNQEMRKTGFNLLGGLIIK